MNNSQVENSYLNLSGGNANQNIDIGSYNFTGSYFIGDGSQLTGISSGSGIWENISGTASYGGDVNVNGTLNFFDTEIIRIWSGNSSLKIGENAGSDILQSVCIGKDAGYQNTGNRLTAIGYQAGYSNDDFHCTFIGGRAGYGASGSQITGIGYEALYGNTQSNIVGAGYHAGYNNAGSSSNFYGYNAGMGNTGGGVTFMGSEAGKSNSYFGCSGYGAFSLYTHSGSFVSAFGNHAGYKNVGSYGSYFGYNSARDNTGTKVSAFGYEAGRSNSGDNGLYLGYEAGEGNTLDDKLIIKQNNINSIPLIYGDFDLNRISINTTELNYPLTINARVNGISIWTLGNISASGFNVRSPRDRNYTRDNLKDLPSPQDILGEDGKLRRETMLKGEGMIKKYNRTIYEEVCRLENVSHGFIKKLNSRYYVEDIREEVVCRQEPKKINCREEEVCEYQPLEEDLFVRSCSIQEICDIAVEEVEEKELSVDYLSFNNRKLISELKEENQKLKSALCRLGLVDLC